MRTGRVWGMATLLAAGCGSELMCTTIAAVSVSVTVTNTEGDALADASVTYSVDGDEPVVCDALGGTEAMFLCGYEVEGTLTIEVTADGYEPFEGEVVVGADECHVLGEALDVELEPVALP